MQRLRRILQFPSDAPGASGQTISTHDKYRPDIDGLRGVAVLSVMFFHLAPSSISGGWVGVDVFFVISGFLITRLIRDQIEAGTFSFGALDDVAHGDCLRVSS